MMISNKLKKTIIMLLYKKFKTKIVGIFGIGSFFSQSMGEISDCDVIVILTDTNDCKKRDWTTRLFEDITIEENGFLLDITLLYGTLEDYSDKNKFSKVSFADFSWAIRSLKFGSILLYGNDIRELLPYINYEYGSIFLRSAYHLNGSSSKYTKMQKITKAIFKFGFFLVTAYYPNSNIFNKIDIYNKIIEAKEDGIISNQMIECYEEALEMREKKINNDNKSEKLRRKFAISFFDETQRSTGYTWNQMKKFLEKGFENGGFYRVIALIETIKNIT